MTITVTDVQLSIWHQDSDSEEPDAIINEGEMNAVQFSERSGEVMDEGNIEVNLPQNNAYDLRLGDRVKFEAIVRAGGGYGKNYGQSYGGGFTIDWTGRIRPTDRNRRGPSHLLGSINAGVTDYVGSILSNRTITGTWVGEDVGEVIRDIVSRKANEVDASSVPNFDVETDVFYQARDCFDAIVNLAAKADCLVEPRGTELHITPIEELQHQFTLTSEDYILPWDTNIGDTVYNVIRVDSGKSRQPELDITGFSSWQTVTDTNRMTYRLRARKSEVHSIDLRVNQISEDDLTLRLQADEGGAPVDISDEDSDIVQESWPGDELPEDGSQPFFFSNHTLPDRDPWLIIEADSDEGQEIGVTESGEPILTSFYPHPVNFETSHQESIDKYGPREKRIERDNLQTLVATQDAAKAELRRLAFPHKTITFEADSSRTHALSPGDIITVDNPEEDAVGDFIVVEADRTFDAQNVRIDTTITAEWRKGILAPE